MDEQNSDKINKVFYDAGCFEDEDPQLFKNTVVGQYYDFGHEVSLEVRSRVDPYMVFSYSKYNLGADFTIMKYLAIGTFVIAGYALLKCFIMFCCYTERIPKKQKKEN